MVCCNFSVKTIQIFGVDMPPAGNTPSCYCRICGAAISSWIAWSMEQLGLMNQPEIGISWGHIASINNVVWDTGWWWLEPWNFMTFHIYWECHHPNWLELHDFFRGVGIPPTRIFQVGEWIAIIQPDKIEAIWYPLMLMNGCECGTVLMDMDGSIDLYWKWYYI